MCRSVRCRRRHCLRRAERQDKLEHAEIKLAVLERDVQEYVSELDAALFLMTELPELFGRLDEKSQRAMLRILVSRLIIDESGRIIDHEQNRYSPIYTASLLDVRRETQCQTVQETSS